MDLTLIFFIDVYLCQLIRMPVFVTNFNYAYKKQVYVKINHNKRLPQTYDLEIPNPSVKQILYFFLDSRAASK